MQPGLSYRSGDPFGMKMENTKRAVMMNTAETRKKKTIAAKIGNYIPGDIISEILLRLPARSLGKFRCLSKSWLSITSNTAFVRANTQHNLITRPSLIIGECEHTNMPVKSYLAFANEASESSIHLQPMEAIPKDSYVVGSCDGLLCLLRFEQFDQYYIMNPLTDQSISLPIDHVAIKVLGFYFHCSTSTYRLLRFKGPVMHESEVLVVGESSWRHIPINIPDFFYCRSPLDLNGNLYWLAYTRDVRGSELPPDIIVIFDEEKEVFSWISPPPPSEKRLGFGGSLINFNGELGVWVIGMDYTINVWIMENIWIKRYSINYAHIDSGPSPQFTAARSLTWILGRAICIGDDELLLDTSKFLEPHYLIRWNLKSGACVMKMLINNTSQYRFTFSYTETLTNPNYSAST